MSDTGLKGPQLKGSKLKMSDAQLPASVRGFYGWRIVHASILIACVSWSFAVYGPSVYLSALSETHGWPMGEISIALTVGLLCNALVTGFVGAFVGRHGARVLVAVGAVLLASGIAMLGQITAKWQAFVAFPLLGLGWSCLGTIAISASVAPWFERHQGKAISTALLGASLGGMVGVPVTLSLVTTLGLQLATLVIGALVITIIVPTAVLVLRRRPADLGLEPDGLPRQTQQVSAAANREWSRKEAMQTYALRSVVVACGLSLMLQVGFLSQQVKFLHATLGPRAISLTIFCAGVLAFTGRFILARWADRINLRHAAGAILGMAAVGLLITGLASSAAVIVFGLLVFGFNIGNITTLPALIVRREFGAASFGRIFGMVSTFMQLMSALGPAIYGILRDLADSYTFAIVLAGVGLIACVLVIMRGEWSKPTLLATS